MMKQQAQVRAFHRATGAHVGDPANPGFANIRLRLDLMLEELKEIGQAAGFYLTEYPDLGVVWDDTDYGDDKPARTPADFIAAIDGLGDELYVLLGAAVEWGVDLEPFFEEIHRSNMTKVGGQVREDGKRLKPPWFSPARLEPILRRQIEETPRHCKCGGKCQQTAAFDVDGIT